MCLRLDAFSPSGWMVDRLHAVGAVPPHGGSGSSSQSHWVSAPGSCSISAVARPLACEHASQCGRSDLTRTSRVSVW